MKSDRGRLAPSKEHGGAPVSSPVATTIKRTWYVALASENQRLSRAELPRTELKITHERGAAYAEFSSSAGQPGLCPRTEPDMPVLAKRVNVDLWPIDPRLPWRRFVTPGGSKRYEARPTVRVYSRKELKTYESL
jgi:hypothetical protein